MLFMVRVAPLLVLVTFARHLAAKAKKSATAKAKAKPKRPSLRQNPMSIERGAYREWDACTLECALSELAECEDH